jgi:hypothetical protein
MSNVAVPNLPSAFNFYALTGQYLNWYMTDALTGVPINDSAITATLYQGRSLTNPTGQPGTPVTFFDAVTIEYVPNSNGQYRAIIPASFDPSPLGSNYVLVVDAVTPGYANQHWEVAATVTSGSPQIRTLPAATINQFRADYPEFANPATFTDSAIRYWMNVAYLLLNAYRWGRMIGVATELFVAHNLLLEARAQQTALAGGLPGESKGAITNQGAGAVTLGYDAASTLQTGAGHWNQTEYGNRFIRTARMFGAGPIQIGPSCIGGFGLFALGGIGGIGTFAIPGAWVGPWPLPGMWNFGN